MYIRAFTDTDRREVTVLGTLLAAMGLLGLSANMVLDFVHVAVKGIVLGAPLACVSPLLFLFSPFFLFKRGTCSMTAARRII